MSITVNVPKTVVAVSVPQGVPGTAGAQGPGGPVGGLAYATAAALSAATVPSDNTLAYIRGYAGENDGGGGYFRYSASSALTVDGGTILSAAGGVGRWLRQWSSELSVKWFGARGDGSTDDTAAIQATIAAANVAGGGVVLFPAGRYKVSSSLAVHQCISYRGAGPAWPGGGFPGTELLVASGSNISLFLGDNTPGGTSYLHHTRIEGMTLTAASGQTSGSGIYVKNTGETFSIRDVRCDGWPDAGIRITGQNAPGRLENLSLNGCAYGLWFDSVFTTCAVYGLSGNSNNSLVYVSNYDTIPTDAGFDFQLTLIDLKSECGASDPITVHNPVILTQNLNRGSIVLVGGSISDWSSVEGTDGTKALIKLTSTASPQTSDVRATGGVILEGVTLVNYPVVLQDNILSNTINHLTGSLNSENSANTWPRIGHLVYNHPNFHGTTCEYVGSGSPNGVITANVGSHYRRTDGALGTSLYVKTSGTGNTGWSQIVPLQYPVQANSGANLTLTTSWQDVSGASITATNAGTYLVTGIFDFNAIGDNGANLLGALNVGGSLQTGYAVLNLSANGRGTVMQQWVASGVAAGAVLKLQAEKDAGTGTSVAYSPQTRLLATWFGP